MKQNETCGALAKATLFAPVSFCQNLNIPIIFATLLSGTGGPAQDMVLILSELSSLDCWECMILG